MKIERINLRQIRMPLVHHFETSFGRTYERRIVLVEVEDSDGAVGWGEVTCGENPFYNEEWVDAAWMILRDYVAPRVLHANLQAAADVAPRLSHLRGHRMAQGGLEAACWELEARKLGKPLWQHLGGTRGETNSGVSIGIQDSIEELLDIIETALAAGYQRIKIKIKPGWDINVIAKVRERFPDAPLMADANSAYTLADRDHLKQLDAFTLMMIEQPLAHDDIIDHAELQKFIETPICLDECIRNAHHAEQAIRLGACRIINIKLGRVGGFTEALRVHDVCAANAIPVWSGGMLEAGIGRAHNIAMSMLSNFSLPGDVAASKRYWQHDIIAPAVEVSSSGTIAAPSALGLGYELDRDRIEALTERRDELT